MPEEAGLALGALGHAAPLLVVPLVAVGAFTLLVDVDGDTAVLLKVLVPSIRADDVCGGTGGC